METLLVFLGIIALQIVGAYFNKQKKEAAKAAKKPLPSWQQTTEPAQSQPTEEPELDEAPVEIKKREPILKEHPADVHQRVSSTLTSQLDLKNPAQGILWAAILHEPRYRVRWKRR